MSEINIFTGKPKGEEHKPKPEPTSIVLPRAEANNPVPHQSGRRGFEGLGGGRRTGGLARGHTKRERARSGPLFGIKDDNAPLRPPGHPISKPQAHDEIPPPPDSLQVREKKRRID
ncbi:MAG: hypothetical protein WEA61_07510 [Anaerolineales bacterium]